MTSLFVMQMNRQRDLEQQAELQARDIATAAALSRGERNSCYTYASL
jgi:hypothetical protein